MTADSLKFQTENIEKKIICHFLNNKGSGCKKIKNEHFSNEIYRIIHREICSIHRANLIFDLDILVEYIAKTITVSKEQLLEIKESFPVSELVNIDQCFNILAERYFSNKSLDELQLLFLEMASKERIEMPKILERINVIKKYATNATEKKIIFTHKDMVDKYKESQHNRDQGFAQKSYGISCLDKVLIRPAAPGEYTAIVAQKNCGKSMMLYHMLNSLTNHSQPVLFLNMEMEEDITIDRRISMRRDISVRDLMAQRKTLETKRIIEDECARMVNDPYMLYVQEAVTLDNYDQLVSKAKEHYYELGVLPQDEYIVVGIDLLTMFKDLSGSSDWQETTEMVDKFHFINKKHKCHPICLLQANESKIRGSKGFRRLTDIDDYKINWEDVKGGSVFTERARMLFTMHRPKQMKSRYFPEMEPEYKHEYDLIHFNLVKANNEEKFYNWKFILHNNFNIVEYREGETPTNIMPDKPVEGEVAP